MASEVRRHLDTRPEVDVILHLHASFDVGLAGREAYGIVDDAVDTALRGADAVPWAEAVFVFNEWTVCDAPLGAATISAEACNGVENDGLRKIAGVSRFVPVSESRVSMT